MKQKKFLLFVFLSILLLFSFLCEVYGNGEENDFVDNNTSNVDGYVNAGTMSNFTAEKYGPDNINDTLTEELISSAGEKTPESTSDISGQWTDDDSIRDDDTGTYAYASIPANTPCASSYPIDALLPVVVPVCDTLRYYIGRQDTYINQVQIRIYDMETTSYVVVYSGAGTWNAWTNVSLGATYYANDIMFLFNNSHASLAKQARVYEVDFYNLTLYKFQYEVQWTNANYTRPSEELCIFAGTMGAENLPVSVRSGSNWVQLFADLTANSWNNISISSYLTSDTFTIMYNEVWGGADDTQDSWSIDCALLHTWAPLVDPTVGEFQAPATAYANKYFFINQTVQDLNGNYTLYNSTLTIVNGTATFLWVNSTNTFSEYSDPSNFWALDAANCLRVYVNATSFRLCFKLKAAWNFTEGSIHVNATVYDEDDLDGTATQASLFTFEPDLIIQSATITVNYANPSASLSMDALVYYQGTSTVPEDATGIVGYVELSGVQKGFDSTINSTGYFTLTWNSEAVLGNHSYNVFAVTNQNTEQNQTLWNWADSLTTTITVGDNNIDINTNASITVSAVYDSDSTPFTGSLTLNETTYQFATACRHNYTVAIVSGGTRSPIDQISVNDEDYVVWNSVTISITVGDNNIDVNTNASITVSGTYDYEGTPFDGTITLNYTTYQHAVIGRHNYTVASISGGSYGITTISVNDEDYVVWDDARIDSGGQSLAYQHVGEDVLIYYALEYEWLNENITDGNVQLNGSDMTYNFGNQRWEKTVSEASMGNYSYVITAVTGNLYGITIINDAVGSMNATFYANINLRTVNSEGDIFSGATVYMSNGTSGFPEPVPGYSTGCAIVGITYYSIEATSGWANWTGITNGTLMVYATWKGLTVNATFSFIITTDTTQDVNCLCYPFTHESQVYHAASNATITSLTYLNYVVTVTFSSSTGNYLLCADSPSPTYLLNVTYNIAVDYTTYLHLTHSGDRNIVMGLQNWGGTYVKKTDRIMTCLTVEGQKLTMTFTGTVSAVGEVDVKCGTRGNPAETGGFTTSSYVDNVFIGYYIFNATEKTVYLQWSPTGPGPIGPIQYPEYPNVYIEISFSFPQIVQPGQKVTGTLNVTWSGVNTVNFETLKCEAPYENWTIQVSTLPIVLSLNATLTKGFISIPVTLTIPARVAVGTYNVPCLTSFTAAPNLVRGFRSALDFQVVAPTTPVPFMLVFAFLGSISVFIVSIVLFASRKQKQRF